MLLEPITFCFWQAFGANPANYRVGELSLPSKYGLDEFSKPEVEPQNLESERIIRQGAFGIHSCLASWHLSAWITIETKKLSRPVEKGKVPIPLDLP